MATTDDNKKKPLVTLDAANPVEPIPTLQELAKSDNQVGAGWGKDNDELPTLTQQQLENIQHAPDGVSVNDINKAPGTSTTPKLNQSTVNSGVLAGAPSQVVIQHLLDQLPPMETKEQREKRERRERINRTMAALGDGFSSLANIYYATKGAPAAEGKTLSAGETERQEKEKKDRETAMERRIRLLKEQQADFYRLQGLKIREKLAENLKEHRANQHQIGMDKNAETNRHNTVMEVQDKDSKQTEAKRKADKDKADKERQDKEAENRNKNRDRNASTNAAKAGEQKRHNQAMENKKSSGGSRSGSSKYTGTTYSANYDAKTGELKGYTVKGRGTVPPKSIGGKSAKSQFSIHK